LQLLLFWCKPRPAAGAAAYAAELWGCSCQPVYNVAVGGPCIAAAIHWYCADAAAYAAELCRCQPVYRLCNLQQV
jgi:hypothetical protein